MKVKLLTSLAGADFVLVAGDEFECSNEEAVRLVRAGLAEAVAEPELERAVKRAPAKRGK